MFVKLLTNPETSKKDDDVIKMTLSNEERRINILRTFFLVALINTIK